MGRKRSFWLRAWDQCWYTKHEGKAVKLGTADEPKQLIEARFRELVALTAQPGQLTAQQVCRAFLDYCEHHRAATTHKWYQDYLDPFCAFLKRPLPIGKLTPSLVSRWIDKQYGKASASTRHAAARAVTRAMNWAVAERLIDRSPLVGFVKPPASSRETTITPAQYRYCLRCAKGPFADVVKFLWHTGCRPQELRIIEARWIDGNKIVLPVAKSKGKKRRRVIYMDATAREIAVRLACDNLYGPIFRNSRDEPWTKNSLNCAFKRLKEKTEIEGLCAYALRHGFATEALKRGVDTTTVSVLMGNSPRMVADVYQHVAQDDSYLLSVVNSG